jgi:hypothetical protein
MFLQADFGSGLGTSPESAHETRTEVRPHPHGGTTPTYNNQPNQCAHVPGSRGTLAAPEPHPPVRRPQRVA